MAMFEAIHPISIAALMAARSSDRAPLQVTLYGCGTVIQGPAELAIPAAAKISKDQDQRRRRMAISRLS